METLTKQTVTLDNGQTATKYLVVNNGKFLMSTEILKETEKAINVYVTRIDSGDHAAFWMPKSVIVSQDADNVTIASWFLAKNPFYSISR